MRSVLCFGKHYKKKLLMGLSVPLNAEYCLELMDADSGLEKGRSNQLSSSGNQTEMDPQDPWTVLPVTPDAPEDRQSLSVSFTRASNVRGLRVRLVPDTVTADSISEEISESKPVVISLMLFAKKVGDSESKAVVDEVGEPKVSIVVFGLATLCLLMSGK